MSHSSHQQPEAALLYGAPKRDPHPVLQRHSVVMPKYCHLPLQSIFLKYLLKVTFLLLSKATHFYVKSKS